MPSPSPSSSPSEEDFARALRAGAELAPLVPTEEFALGAERRGRRRVLRRRAGIASTVALVAAAGLVPALLPDRGKPAAHVPASTPPRVDGAFMLDTLTAMLPPGGTVSDGQGSGPDQNGPGQAPQAFLNYDDGHGGKAQLLLATDLVATPVTTDAQRLLCYEPIVPGNATCRPAARPDGSHLLTSSYGGSGTDEHSLNVAYTTATGRQVVVQEVAADRSVQQLPLDTAKLTEIVTAAQWQWVFGSLGDVPSRPPARPAPSGERMLAALTPLLHGAHLDTGRTSTDLPGRIRVDVTVNGRTSALLLGVTPGWRRSYPTDPAVAFPATHRSVDRRPDGTMVSTTPLGSTPGTADGGYLADALLPDGTRVNIRLWNSDTGRDGERPGEPVLTLDQLSALVTDPVWTTI
ncbi:hypothetical protein [Kitasatospora phosalacinea]|uniref:Uncharacterized protein n=1 Tax=Kitasatospora phosalacinea TaxID=2065 RepID=A0A9W6PEP1_9ACTN|nr:hypothetical protein [Kitasatospora phosalacinea]GLW53522.1 hypothetical protein Kpho01_15330 [Kitasatospora phosalacinea]